MSSYGLEERFKTPKDCFRLLDPTAYSNTSSRISAKQNKYPFLSNTPRKTATENKSYTDSIYFVDLKHNIPNAASLKSQVPRFPYESFHIKDLEDILCRCGYEKTCECPTEEKYIDEVICQANVRKRLFKSPPPSQNVGLSCPGKRDHGFEILADGTTRRLLHVVKEECPPFYDSRVNESTEYYRGCKWSKWTSKRSVKSLEVRPGPADYTVQREKTRDQLCLELLRADRRGKSKQPRYVEQIQQQLIREERPGPADYNPKSTTGIELRNLGSKAERFMTPEYEQRPSPNTYFVKRLFDLPDSCMTPCLAKLPSSAGFGCKAARFTYRLEQRPGPADYDANVKLCKVQNCSTAPFGVSATRFKSEYADADSTDEDDNFKVDEEKKICVPCTFQFKSKTSRFVSSKEKFDSSKEKFDSSILRRKETSLRSFLRNQCCCPFNSSLGRFQPWKDWLPVYGSVETPGPGYYKITKPGCLMAENCGPLFRAARFLDSSFQTPAPNEYSVGGGVETVLTTHNKRLNENMRQMHKFRWHQQQKDKTVYSPEVKELMTLDKAIAQLDVSEEEYLSELKKREHHQKKNLDVYGHKHSTKNVEYTKKKVSQTNKPEQKILRTFLHKHPQQHFF